MRLTRHARHDQSTTPGNEDLRDGIGGTVASGPPATTGVLGNLEPGAREASRGGAVSGAAQIVADSPDRRHGIALSDGSRISFASIADVGLLRDDNVPMAVDEQTSARKDIIGTALMPSRPRGRAGDKGRAAGKHRRSAPVTV
jgi:hypothetical protein